MPRARKTAAVSSTPSIPSKPSIALAPHLAQALFEAGSCQLIAEEGALRFGMPNRSFTGQPVIPNPMQPHIPNLREAVEAVRAQLRP